MQNAISVFESTVIEFVNAFFGHRKSISKNFYSKSRAKQIFFLKFSFEILNNYKERRYNQMTTQQFRFSSSFITETRIKNTSTSESLVLQFDSQFQRQSVQGS